MNSPEECKWSITKRRRSGCAQDDASLKYVRDDSDQNVNKEFGDNCYCHFDNISKTAHISNYVSSTFSNNGLQCGIGSLTPPCECMDVDMYLEPQNASDSLSPDLLKWLHVFSHWNDAQRCEALTKVLKICLPSQIGCVRDVIESIFRKDFISLLPLEVSMKILSCLSAFDLARCSMTCRLWHYLANAPLLWKQCCYDEKLLDPNGVMENGQGTEGANNIWKRIFVKDYLISQAWAKKPLPELQIHKAHESHVITCLLFDGDYIVSGSDDNHLRIWYPNNTSRWLIGHKGGVWCAELKVPYVISGSTDRTVRVWNIFSGDCLHILHGHSSTVRCLAVFNNRIISGSRDGTLRMWDIDTGQCMHMFIGHLAAVRCVCVNEIYVVSGAYDFNIRVWKTDTAECVFVLRGHTNRVYSLQFNGDIIASGSLDSTIRIWSVSTGVCLHTLVGHKSLTSGMSLQGETLVSGNADSTLKIWSIKTGKCLFTLAGRAKHRSAVTALCFNRKYIISSSDDGTVKLWNTKTGEFIRDLVVFESGLSRGVIWNIRCTETKLVCAAGSRNGSEGTNILVLDFSSCLRPLEMV